MKTYVVYDLEGRILRVVKCPPDMAALQAFENEFVMEGVADDLTHYVLDSQIVLRPVNPAQADKQAIAADGVEILTITSVPNPTTATISGPLGDRLEVTDGVLTVSVDVPGAYTVRLSSFPYKDKELRFVAT